MIYEDIFKALTFLWIGLFLGNLLGDLDVSWHIVLIPFYVVVTFCFILLVLVLLIGRR